jgi:hypothetical protein
LRNYETIATLLEEQKRITAEFERLFKERDGLGDLLGGKGECLCGDENGTDGEMGRGYRRRGWKTRSWEFWTISLLRRRFGCEISLQRGCEHLLGEDDKCLGVLNIEHRKLIIP